MPLHEHYDIDDIRTHNATIEVRDNGENKYRVHAKPGGNCTLFNRVVRSNKVRLGNVTTGDDGQLILNVKAI